MIFRFKLLLVVALLLGTTMVQGGCGTDKAIEVYDSCETDDDCSEVASGAIETAKATEVCDSCETDDDCSEVAPGAIEGVSCVAGVCCLNPGPVCTEEQAREACE